MGNKLGDNRVKILFMMLQNPRVSIPELAKEIGISTTAIEKNIAYLKKECYLKRFGSAKSGHWEVTNS